MADQGRLKALRAEALHAERNAGKKISRNKTKGVVIAGTESDPRKGAARINSLNTKQLEAQINRVTAFNSRKTQFVAGVRGAPLPRAAWTEHKQAETAYNQKAQAENATIFDVKLPNGTTIGERQAVIRPDHPMMGNPSVKVPNQPIIRQPGNVTNVKALKKLTKDLKEKMTPAYDRKQLKKSREELSKIMAVIDNPELNVDIGKLTNRQFNLLWNFSQFAKAASLQYEIIQARAKGKDEPWYAKQIDDSFSEATKLVKWAKDQ